ncbi:VCBS repeat-containing protein [Yoonia maritima]|uniref:VCBS repeat-containing protein n=1 Tax=Yoonia maritima TaxID=1435347 RepID=A0A2T0W4M2_9RHOB|nr:Hint domain-containing protein [Yoonia maritima]PRY80373.1 VCBS repeat-containing protein [Yoonia maritima]
MGAPTIDGDIVGSVIEDSGDIVSGDLDDVGLLTGNDDDTWTISLNSTYGSAAINADGQWTYTLDDTNAVVNDLDPGETLTDTFTVRMVDINGGSDTQEVTITISGVFCLSGDMRIETATGLMRIQHLKVGDRVLTENGYQKIRWIGSRKLGEHEFANNSKFRPIRIMTGALGNNLPEHDLIVSRQHRMLVDSSIAERMFKGARVLVPAIKLAALPGIFVDDSIDSVEYFHLLFDQHQIIYAEGAPTESLYTGPEALKSVGPDAREEILAIFPELANRDYAAKPAYPIPPGKLQRELVEKHLSDFEPVMRSVSND